MNTKYNIVKHILGLFVALSILLPSSLSLAHTFENHEHYTQCDNALDVHVHEKKQECKFHLINYNKDGVFAFTKTPSFAPQPFFVYFITYKENLQISTLEKENTRGPPTC